MSAMRKVRASELRSRAEPFAVSSSTVRESMTRFGIF
jgi:hypothetical protein